jgi:hypothetical protein
MIHTWIQQRRFLRMHTMAKMLLYCNTIVKLRLIV